MELVYSDVESRRFGLRVFRSILEDIDPDALRSTLVEVRADVAICRLAAAGLSRLAELEALGMPVVVADTLVHYYRDLALPPDPPRNADLDFAEGKETDNGVVRRLVEQTFPGYANHYASNRVLDGQGILEGYVEWAAGYLGAGPEKRVWLARRAGEPVALATCRYDGETAEGVLFGVLPRESGKGIYRDLIRFTMDDAARRGCTWMHVSTQVHNFAVQKVWAEEGFVMRSAQVTFHVNALLDSSSPEAVTVDLEAGDEPGWVDRAVRRCLGEVFPGREEAVAGLRQWTSGPLLAEGERCRLRIGFPATGGAGPAVVAQVSDQAGALRHLAYRYRAPGVPGGR
jgi:GNAT superfamily N-acetyltransferase